MPTVQVTYSFDAFRLNWFNPSIAHHTKRPLTSGNASQGPFSFGPVSITCPCGHATMGATMSTSTTVERRHATTAAVADRLRDKLDHDALPAELLTAVDAAEAKR